MHFHTFLLILKLYLLFVSLNSFNNKIHAFLEKLVSKKGIAFFDMYVRVVIVLKGTFLSINTTIFYTKSNFILLIILIFSFADLFYSFFWFQHHFYL